METLDKFRGMDVMGIYPLSFPNREMFLLNEILQFLSEPSGIYNLTNFLVSFPIDPDRLGNLSLVSPPVLRWDVLQHTDMKYVMHLPQIFGQLQVNRDLI